MYRGLNEDAEQVQPSTDVPDSNEQRMENVEMTDAEATVMRIVRFYGVVPYQMLCLNLKVQQNLHDPLDRLIRKGFIVCEGHHDAYHLTPTGYRAVSQSE